MKSIITFFIICVPAFIFSQAKILGKVVSEKGTPLQGASVFIQNTTIGVSTDAQGEFAINKVPPGNVTIVVSFVGYEVTPVTIPVSDLGKRYIIKLQPQSNELTSVIIGNYDKRGWKKWGTLFSNAFIGTSSYAKGCSIINKDIIRFNYNKKTDQLRAYASEPLLIENKSLGYNISVTVVDFVYNLSTKNVDYQFFSLFKEMQGTDDQQLEWKKNREDAYSFSLMHFMRALHAKNFKNEGFQVRMIERSVNREQQRVEVLYKKSFERIKDSLGNENLNENSVSKLIEKTFDKDSVVYYKKILEQDSKTQNLHFELSGFKDIATETVENTVLLNFKDLLQVTYTKKKEPQEYTAYRNELFNNANSSPAANDRIYPSTELTLTQGIPVEINENGYFNNVDLYIVGFWGWWEKMATKLPYGYEP